MDPLGSSQATDPADLDVDDGTGTEVESRLGTGRRCQRFVEAKWCLQLRRKCGVVGEIIPMQWLLDVVQAELVDRVQHIEVVERVCRVGIDRQLDRGELGAHGR